MKSLQKLVAGVALMVSSFAMSQVDNVPGNTVVNDVPSDYFPAGSGYWYTIPSGKDSGKKMFFRDSVHNGTEPQETILFVHGNPESSYTYRNVVQTLIENANKAIRIVAMDHIGFGLSDQATYETVAMDHAENLLQLVNHLDLQDFTMVVHDWGGPIGIGAMLQESYRVKNLVVINSTVFPIPETGLTYNNHPNTIFPWAKTPSRISDADWGGFASHVVLADPLVSSRWSEINAYIDAANNGQFPDDHYSARKFYWEQFQSTSNVKMSKRMVRQSGHWGQGNSFRDPNLGWRSTDNFYATIQSEINAKWGPYGANIGVRSVLGRLDPLGQDQVIAQWVENLPQLEGHVTVFEQEGHFVAEVEYVAIADAIVDVAGLR